MAPGRLVGRCGACGSPVPIRTKIECPECGTALVVKHAGACPNCGAKTAEHVARIRARERRIDQAVAVFATALVVGLFLITSEVSLIEGVAAYAAVGAAVFWIARRTFI